MIYLNGSLPLIDKKDYNADCRIYGKTTVINEKRLIAVMNMNVTFLLPYLDTI